MELCCQVVAVAARKLKDAQEFAQRHNIPRAYGSYEELARDPDIGEIMWEFFIWTKMSKQCSDFYFSLNFPLLDPEMRCRKLLHCLFICADVVYIGVIHPYHLSTSLLFTNAKKNVLCEKPLAMNTKEVRKILESAKKNDVFLMEVGMLPPKLLHYN